MTTLIEKSILNERLEKSRSGIYANTSENRRKHRVGQKYGSEKKEEEKPEKTSSNEEDPTKELEAVDKVIAAINEGKLKLPQEEIMVLIEKKNNLELAKRQAEKIHSGVKANEEKRNAAEVKETSKKINEAQKEEEKKIPTSVKIEQKTFRIKDGKISASMYDTQSRISKVTKYAKENGLEVEWLESKKEASEQASDPIYQVQQKKKEASKKYDSKREEARQKYDKEADEIRSEIDKLYESDHPDAAKKRKELWNTLKEKTNKYDAETSRLKDEYEAEYRN